MGRNYYGEFTNTLRSVHWRGGELDQLQRAVLDLAKAIRARKTKHKTTRNQEAKAAHYEELVDAYLEGWTGFGAESFPIAESVIQIGNLEIRVNPDIGMRYAGNEYAVKLWVNSPKPTRQYRETIQHLMTVGRGRTWKPEWQAAMWDVRRKTMLPKVTVRRDFDLALEGQAAAFEQIYTRLAG